MRVVDDPAAGDRHPSELAAALRREVIATLRLLERDRDPGQSGVMTPVLFRFASAEPGGRSGASREIVISVNPGGLETVERAISGTDARGTSDGG